MAAAFGIIYCMNKIFFLETETEIVGFINMKKVVKKMFDKYY